MPVSGLRLLQLLQRPVDALDVQELATLVEQDPVLTARMLRIANSPLYGALRDIHGVKPALITIGLDEAVSALNYFLIRKLMPKVPVLPHFNSQAFWTHSVACATAARMLGNPNYNVASLPGELYLAGLLHDIGKLLMAIYLPEEFGRILEQAHREQAPLHQVERAVLGVDHALLGAHLLDEWRLPPPILDAVCCHHDPWDEHAKSNELALLVHLADRVANQPALENGEEPAPAQSDECLDLRAGLGTLAGEEGWRQYLGVVAQRLTRHAAQLDDATPARREGAVAPAASEGRPAAPAFRAPSLWRRIMAWFGG